MAFKKQLHFTRNATIIGILVMLLGDFLFAANDAMGKMLVSSFSVGQVLFIRSLGAFIILAPMLMRENFYDLFHPSQPFKVFLRVLWGTGDTALFYAAVQYLPLANVMTFYMAGPIYVAAISHFFLNEKIGWQRWLAIFIGFIGVIIALRPSPEMFATPASLYAILGSLSFALLIIYGRLLRKNSDTILVTWQTIGALVTGLILMIGHWTQPSAQGWTLMALLGVVSCLGHLLISRALKLAPAAVLAPIQYTLLLWAVIFDLMFFNHKPMLSTMVGAAIIILSGLFIFHRKKVVAEEITESDVPKTNHH